MASDGGIFSYGDAQFYGSTGSLVLNKPDHRHDRRGRTGPGTSSSPPTAASSASARHPFFGSLGGLPLKHPIVAAAATPDGSGYWFTDTAGLVSNFGAASYYGSAPSPLNRPIVGMAEAPGQRRPSWAGPTPRAPTATTSASTSARASPPGTTRSASCRWTGARRATPNPCLAQEAAWAGGGLNLYTYLTYATSTTNEPGCNGDTSCNAGYQAGIHAYTDAADAGAGSTPHPWWLDVETAGANWSGNFDRERAVRPRRPQRARTRPRGSRTSASTPARACGTTSSATTSRTCPTGWPTTCRRRAAPRSCADIGRWQSDGQAAPKRTARDRAVRQPAVRHGLRLLSQCAGRRGLAVSRSRSRPASP